MADAAQPFGCPARSCPSFNISSRREPYELNVACARFSLGRSVRPEEDHMFLGILIGTICLIGLVRALVGRRYYGGFHHYGGYGYGPPGWGGWGGYGHGPYGGRRRGFLYSILA